MYDFENREMCIYEDSALLKGYRLIAGIDEVGRGALAGPVVAACVILNPHRIPQGIRDSKKLSDGQRRTLFELISDTACSIGIGCIEPKIIDEVNIYNATKMAMKSALLNMDKSPDFLLIDDIKLYDISISSLSFSKGESKSVSVAAASIIAKVYRDDIMIKLSNIYPLYGFSSHKGYATSLHKEALFKYGPTDVHRYSYSPVVEVLEKWKQNKHF